jgi:hypothetical protein
MVTGERAARTGNAEMTMKELNELFSVLSSYCSAIQPKLMFHVVDLEMIAFIHSEYIAKHPEERKADE